jgi:hypothetical protein
MPASALEISHNDTTNSVASHDSLDPADDDEASEEDVVSSDKEAETAVATPAQTGADELAAAADTDTDPDDAHPQPTSQNETFGDEEDSLPDVAKEKATAAASEKDQEGEDAPPPAKEGEGDAIPDETAVAGTDAAGNDADSDEDSGDSTSTTDADDEDSDEKSEQKGGTAKKLGLDAEEYAIEKEGKLVVNHSKAAMSSPTEKMMGKLTAYLLIGFTVFAALILYVVNYPDPQVENYGNKIVSTGMSVCCAVLLENIFMYRLKPIAVVAMMNWFDIAKGSRAHAWTSFVTSFSIFIVWYAIISIAAFHVRTSGDDLYAVKAYIAHVTAFMAIHAFGYMEKSQCKMCENYDQGLSCYIWSLIFSVLIVYACTFVGQSVLSQIEARHEAKTAASKQKATQDGTADAPPDMAAGHSSGSSHEGDHHKDHWVHTALEGEGDAAAIVLSFLVRQLVLFAATGRIPSTKGDSFHHDSENWTWLFGAIALNVVLLVIATIVKEKYVWASNEGDFGAAGQNLHVSQFVLSMCMGWNCLTAAHWFMQSQVKHPAAWNIGTAFAVTPIAFLVIIIVDKLADFQFVGALSEPLILNSAGLVLGFSWEVAFASGIDEVGKTVENANLLCILLMAALICIILPAWRIYIVPRAAKPVPPRDVA